MKIEEKENIIEHRQVDTEFGELNRDHTQLEELFRLVVDAVPDAIVMFDQGGKIKLVNKQTETMFGYSPVELMGNRVEILLPKRFRSKHTKYRKGYFKNPVERPVGEELELFALHKDGSEFPVNISLNTIQTDNNLLVQSRALDIWRSGIH